MTPLDGIRGSVQQTAGALVPGVTVVTRFGSFTVDLTSSTPQRTEDSGALGALARVVLRSIGPKLVIHTVAGDLPPIDLGGD